MRRRWMLGLLALGSCSDEAAPAPLPEPTALFDEVCGAEGPYRLLPLAAGEHAYRLDPLADDERVLISTFFVDPQTPLASFPPTLDLAVYAVDPCGETSVSIAPGLSLTSGHDGLLLGCDADGHGIFVLDPSGAEPPRPLLDGWCPLRSTAAGVLTVQAPPDERYGPLVIVRDPANPAALPETLISDLRVPRNAYFGPGGNTTTSLWTSDTEAIGLSGDGVVIRVDLSSGEPTELLSGVRELRISGGGGGSMIWQALEPTEGDPDTPIGPVFVRDLSAQTDTHLLNTHLEWTGNPFAGEYLVIRDDVQGPRVFRPDGEVIELPDGTDFRGVLGGGELWLARRVDAGTEELRWTPGDAPTVITLHAGQVVRRDAGLEIFEVDDVSAPSEGSLHFVPWEGGEPTRLADHVHQSRGQLADGRILTIVYEDVHHHGSLRLVDPDTGGWTLIDPLGYVQSPRLNRHDPFDGDIVWSVARPDLDEDRRGVYRARVPH